MLEDRKALRDKAQGLLRSMQPDANKWNAEDLALMRQADAIYLQISQIEHQEALAPNKLQQSAGPSPQNHPC